VRPSCHLGPGRCLTPARRGIERSRTGCQRCRAGATDRTRRPTIVGTTTTRRTTAFTKIPAVDPAPSLSTPCQAGRYRCWCSRCNGSPPPTRSHPNACPHRLRPVPISCGRAFDLVALCNSCIAPRADRAFVTGSFDSGGERFQQTRRTIH
jgi:hypothetical protein